MVAFVEFIERKTALKMPDTPLAPISCKPLIFILFGWPEGP